MTIRKFTKTIACSVALTALSLASAWSAQRVATYSEALEKAGDDGIIAYCYGPDWNRRSVRMLNTFWKTPETEAAAGNAVMVAIPFYEDANHPKAGEAADIRGGFPDPPFGVCPVVVMLDKTGKAYAHMPGADYLGDEDGEKGRENMRNNLSKFRKYQEIMKKLGLRESGAQEEDTSAGMRGEERAKLLAEAIELQMYIPGAAIAGMPPHVNPDLLRELELADPADKTGLVRRFKHVELQFRYMLYDTTDGFLKPDFMPDIDMMKEESFKIIKDPAYRAFDRQSAYLAYIGQARREGIQPNQLKGHIKKMGEIDPNTVFGRCAPALHDLWGSIKVKKTPEQRKAARQKKKEDAKKKKDKKIRDRRQNEAIEF